MPKGPAATPVRKYCLQMQKIPNYPRQNIASRKDFHMPLHDLWQNAFTAMLAEDPCHSAEFPMIPGLEIRIADQDPAGNILGRVRGMAMAQDTIVPHQEFMPMPERDGFSLVALDHDRCAGQISLHLWSLADGHCLQLHLDAVFVDARRRKEGIAAILARAAATCVADVVRRAVAADQAALDMFDRESVADANAGGAAVLRHLDRELQRHLDRIDATVTDRAAPTP